MRGFEPERGGSGFCYSFDINGGLRRGRRRCEKLARCSRNKSLSPLIDFLLQGRASVRMDLP